MEIKILESSSTPELEKLITKFLKKGWKMRGKLFQGQGCLTIMICKK